MSKHKEEQKVNRDTPLVEVRTDVNLELERAKNDSNDHREGKNNSDGRLN